jgi:hypothetical protein
MAIVDLRKFAPSLAYVHQMDIGPATGSGGQALAQ